MKHYAKLVIALFAILCPTAGFAQKDYAAEKALITKVKRSPGTYVYAEATCRTEEEAKSIAEDVFLQNINEYVASQKKLRGANNIVVNNQKGLQQTVTMPRGSNMHRVFMYVKKNDIIPADNSVVLSKEEVARPRLLHLRQTLRLRLLNQRRMSRRLMLPIPKLLRLPHQQPM